MDECPSNSFTALQVTLGRECADCGATTNLEVHHLKPVGGGSNPFDVEQLVTLCHSCHNQFPFA